VARGGDVIEQCQAVVRLRRPPATKPLGHPDDFGQAQFRALLKNALAYLTRK
jgi:hypothetical protein